MVQLRNFLIYLDLSWSILIYLDLSWWSILIYLDQKFKVADMFTLTFDWIFLSHKKWSIENTIKSIFSVHHCVWVSCWISWLCFHLWIYEQTMRHLTNHRALPLHGYIKYYFIDQSKALKQTSWKVFKAWLETQIQAEIFRSFSLSL